MLKIEEGKYYKTRDGRKVGPFTRRTWTDGFPWDESTEDEYFWSDDGSCQVTSGGCNDLIAEWTDGPIVTETVTKTRIVPGVYDGVEVVASQYEGVIGIHMARTYTPDQLDAAAAVLSALAKGLRDA